MKETNYLELAIKINYIMLGLMGVLGGLTIGLAFQLQSCEQVIDKGDLSTTCQHELSTGYLQVIDKLSTSSGRGLKRVVKGVWVKLGRGI